MTATPRVRTRFAPSPTGPLHIGGVRTALYCYLFARRHGGDFLLRIEDTDQTRSVPGAEQYIMESLRWLNIVPDESPMTHPMQDGKPDTSYRQSERKPIYRKYAEQLVEAGHAYYAFDTEDDLDAMRKRLEAAGNKSPQYGIATREYMQNSLTLPQDEVQRRLAAGDPYVIRIKIPRKEEIRFEDIVRGWVVVHSNTLDDKVLMKSDGMPTYHMANIVDDHLMNITHVIRGEEWLPSAPLHVLLYQFLGWERPAFAHLPLILRPDGNGKLSKRDGDRHGFPVFPLDWTDPATGEPTKGYREAGFLPDALLNFLALLGWNPGNDQELLTREELISLFSLERVGKSGVKFDKAKCEWYNQTYIRQTPVHELLPLVKTELARLDVIAPNDERLGQIIGLLHDRAVTLKDFYLAGRYLYEPVSGFEPAEPPKAWGADSPNVLQPVVDAWQSLSDWTPAALEASFKESIAAAGGNPGKAMPQLRYALSGMTFGPHLWDIAEFLGREHSLANIKTMLGRIG